MKQIFVALFYFMEFLLRLFAKGGNRPFHDPARYPWVKQFEDSYEDIRAEVEKICTQRHLLPSMEDLNQEQYMITTKDQWKTYFLYAYGESFAENRMHCPVTSSLLEKVPNKVMAFFSVLEPNAELKPHRGIYKGVLRYHLGVRIPENTERCGITVRDKFKAWKNGGSLMFDDSMMHYAENKSDEYRVVLIIDFEREIPFWLKKFNRAVIDMIGKSDFVKDSIEKQKSYLAKQNVSIF